MRKLWGPEEDDFELVITIEEMMKDLDPGWLEWRAGWSKPVLVDGGVFSGSVAMTDSSQVA